MPDKTVTVEQSGGDYTSFAAAIAGELSANSDLTALAGILHIVTSGEWTAPDTSRVVVSGFTVSSSYHVSLECYSETYELSPTTNNGFIRIENQYTHVKGFHNLSSATSQSAGNPVDVYATDCVIDSVWVKDTTISGGGAWSGFYSGGTRNVFVNCIASNLTAAWGGFDNDYASVVCYNCDSVNVISVYGQFCDIPTLKNCYAAPPASGSQSMYVRPTAMTTCFGSLIQSGVTQVAFDTSTFTNVTAGSEDLSLVSGSGLIDAGTDLSGDATYPFNWDFLGNTRTGTPDVGAIEFVSGGTPQEIAGTSSSVSGASGSITVAKPIAGSSASLSSASGSLSVFKRIAASSASASGAFGALVVGKPISGVSSALSGTAGSVLVGKAISGVSASISGALGQITVWKRISGASASRSGESASVFVAKHIAGTSASVSGAYGYILVALPRYPKYGVVIMAREDRLSRVERDDRVACMSVDGRTARMAPEEREVTLG